MVAIVSGNSLGLNLTSLGLLAGANSLGQQGGNGVFGTAAQGSSQEQVVVDASTGNLVIQDQDAVLAGIDDSDIVASRTYNSQATTGNGWLPTTAKSMTVFRGPNAISRTDADGSTSWYYYDRPTSRWVQSGGQSSTFNTFSVNAAGQYVWTNGSTGATETYTVTVMPNGTNPVGDPGVLRSSADQYGTTSTYSYDTSGNLTTIASSSGESINYAWTGGQLASTSVTLQGGATLNEVSYAYDGSGRLSTVTVNLNADGTVPAGAETASTYVTTYTYDGTSNRVASITQGDGTKVSFAYTLVGSVYKLSSYTDGNGATTTLTYAATASGGATTIKDAYGAPSVFTYDTTGRLLSVVKGTASTGSSTISYAYNTQGEVSKVTDGGGRVVSMTYDTAGRLLTQADALGDTLTLTYGASNQVATRTVSGAGVAGEVDRYVYAAALGTALRFSISPEGVVTEYRYNSQYQVTSTLQYDAHFDLSTLGATAVPTEAQMQTWAAAQDQTLVQREDFAYDLRGNLSATTTWGSVDASGNGVASTASTTHYVYDQRGALLQTIAADASTASNWVYDQLGRVLVASTGAAGSPATSTLTQYDDAHGKTIVTQANGEVTSSTIDANGRVISVSQLTTGGGTATTQYAYDADGNLLMTTDPTGKHAWMLYDGAGRKVADIDAAGDLVQYYISSSGRVTATLKFLAAVDVTKLVDANGNPTTASNGNPVAGSVTLASVRPTTGGTDNSWTFYDMAGRVIYTVDALGYVTQTEYDADSNVADTIRYATAIATSGLGNGQGITPATLVVANAADRRETSLYNRDGQLTATVDGEGYLTAYTYDASSRLVQTTAYATAIAGYPNAATLAAIAAARTSDSLAGLLPATSPDDISTWRQYDDKGQQVGQVDGDGYLTETVYDADGRVAQVVRYATPAVLPVSTTSTLASLRPASSPADRVSSAIYDAFGRVATQTNFDGTVTRNTYDAVGNLVQSTVAANTADQRGVLAQYDLQGRLTASLSADGAALLTGNQTADQIAAIWNQYGTTYTYDAAGRLTSQTAPDADRTVFFYDDAGRLRYTVDAAGGVTENTYDALGDLGSTNVYATAVTPAALAAMTGGLLSASANAASVTALSTASTTAAALNDLTQYSYDADQNLHAKNLFAFVQSVYAYDAFGERITETRSTEVAPIKTTVFSTVYDRRGEATRQTVAITAGTGSASTTSATYDAFGRVVTRTDAMGKTTVTGYDQRGQVVSVTDPLGDVQAATYDAFGRVLTRTDALGNDTQYTYDDQARSLVVTTAEGVTFSTASNAEGQVQTVVDGDGNTTAYAYDADGNLLATTSPSGVVANAYDAADRLVSTTDATGALTTYTYDAVGRTLSRTVDPAGLALTTKFTYDAKGDVLTTTDPRGIVTTMTYDRHDEMLSSVVDGAGLGLRTTYTYDQIGDVLTVTSPAGNLTQYVYDNLGRRTQTIVDPNGLKLTTTYAYDADDRVIAVTDPDLNVTRYVYDDAGRVAFIVDGAGDVTQNVYDAQGNVIETISHAQRIDLTQWDGVSTPSAIWDPEHDSDVLRFYDSDNRVRFVLTDTGENGGRTYEITELEHDGNGNVTSRIDYATPVFAPELSDNADGIANLTRELRLYDKDRVTRNVYDAAGNLAWTADGMGDVVQFTYDANGRVIKEVAYANQLAGDQDPSTVQPSARGDDRTTYYAYDAAGRLAYAVDGTRAVTQMVYDLDGNVVETVAYAQLLGALATSTFTAAQIASAVVGSDPNNRITRAVYDNGSRQIYSIDALGFVTFDTYDKSGRVIATTQYATAIATAPLTPASTVANIAALIHTNTLDRTTLAAFDGAGRQVFVVDALGYATKTGYDALGNVTSVTAYGTTVSAAIGASVATITAALHPDATKDRTQSFTYDAAGNQRTATDPLGHTQTYGYDALGNQVSITKANGAICTYEYDAAGHQIFAVEPSSDLSQATVTTQYVYDALGNVVTRYDAVGTALEHKTNFTYDALSRLASSSVAEHVYQLPRTDGYGGPYGGGYGGYGEYGGGYGGYGGGEDPNQPGTPYYHDVNAYDYTDAGPIAADPGRTEIIEDATTQYRYDAFGDLVAMTDPAGASEVRTFDNAGRVAFDIDATGLVTQYQRDAFGDATSTVTYATWSSFAATAANGDGIPDTSEVAHALTTYVAYGWIPAPRTTTATYDALGRQASVTLPSVWVDDGVGHSMQASPVTRFIYDGFGDLIQVGRLADATANTWANTTSLYDKRGMVTAILDPMGYLTTQQYDAVGNVTKVVQYANAATNVTTSGYTAPAASTLNREIDYAYDLADHVVSATRVAVGYSTASDGTATTGNLTTSYTYDVFGNVASTTDPLGRVTYDYYDVNGLLAATAGPARTSVVDGQTFTFIPLTTFQRDVNGNVTAQVEHGAGAASASASGYAAAPNPTPGQAGGPSADRITTTTYDLLGRAITVVDPEGQSHYTSYDIDGRVAKTWDYATEANGRRISDVTLDSYDVLGRIVDEQTSGDVGTIDHEVYYDDFGEVTQTSTTSSTEGTGTITSYDYDAAGRLWRSRDGNVYTVYQNNLLGYRTAQIASTDQGTNGTDGANLSALANAQAAEALTGNVQRTDYKLDVLGRVLVQTLPSRVNGASTSSTLERPTITQTYDRWGNMLTRTDVRNAAWVTSFTYNANDQVTQETQPNASGVTTAAPVVTQLYYDAVGRQVARRDVDGLATQTWDAGDDVLTSTRIDGKTLAYAYDIFGDLVEATDATGNITKYGYDTMGHQVFAARVDDDAYQAGGFLGVASATVIERSSYDAAGNRIVDVDAEGDTTEYVYGNDNQVVETIAFQNKSDLSSIYGQGGDLPDAGNDRSSFVLRDSMGRVAWTGGGGSGTTHYTYTSTGQISRITQSAYELDPAMVGEGVDPNQYVWGSSDDRVQSFLYDTAGQLVASFDADHYVTRYTYDAAGRLIDSHRYARPMPKSPLIGLNWYDWRNYPFSDAQIDAMTPATDPGDVELHYFYDDAGQVVGQTDGDGFLTETTYDVRGQVTKQVLHATPVTVAITASTTLSQIRPAANAGDRTTTNVWDTRGRLTSTVDPLGTLTTYAYDINSDVVQKTVSVGPVGLGLTTGVASMTTLARYDSEGRLLQQLPPQGAALITSAMAPAQVEAIWSQYGTQYVYDAAGRLTSTIAPDNDRTLFFYNDAGQIVYTIDATGNVTEDGYDGTGQVSDTTVYSTPIDPVTLATMRGGLISAGATANDLGAIKAAEESSEGAETTHFEYDGSGRLALVSDDVGTKHTQYNAFGEIQISWDGNQDTYDHRGNLVAQSHPDSGGGTNAYQFFDAFGRLATQTDAYGYQTTYAYDHDGQLITATDATGDQTHTGYDVRGRILTITDLRGNVTHYAYTDAPRTMSVTTPDGIVYKSTYDNFGRLVSVTDINGATTTYTYDLAGDVLTRTGPDGTVTNTYDAADRLLTTKDSATGIETDYAYDAVGRVLTVTVDPTGLAQVTRYAYDAFGNAATTIDPNGLVTLRSFDSEHNVLTSTVDPDGLALTTSYTHDLEHDVTSVTTPDGGVTNYYYAEGSHRLLSTQTIFVNGFETVEVATQYAYDRDGRVSMVSSGDSTTHYAYDADGRLRFTVDGMGDVTQTVYNAAGDVLDTIEYATPIDLSAWDGVSQPPVTPSAFDRHDYRLVDSLGRVTATVDSEGDVTTFAYDAKSRVIATRAYATQVSHGDPAGLAAVVAAARSSGSLGALVPAMSALDQKTFNFYDALGRVVGQVDAAGLLTVTTYDTANRVTATVTYATPITATITATITAATTLASITPAAQAADRHATATYDILGRVTSSTDWHNNLSTYAYDVAGHVVQSTLAQGTSDARTTMSRYDIAGRVTATLSGDGAVLLQPGMTQDQTDAVWAQYGTTYTHDGEGRVASMTDADGVRTLYYYDDAGDLRFTVDGAGDVTENTFDRGGRLQTQVRYATSIDAATLAGMTGGSLLADGVAALPQALRGFHALSIVGGGGGNGTGVMAVFDAVRDADATDNSVTRYQYDDAGQLSVLTDANGNTTTYGYDAFGDVARTTRSNVGGHSTLSTESYDTRGLETGAILDVGGANVVMSVVRDAFGRAVGSTDGNGKTSTTTYDVMGRIVGTLDPTGATESFTYDVFGRVLRQQDARGDSTTYVYDDANRKVTMTTPEGISLSTTVNREGQVVATVDGNGNSTGYVYDADGNLLSTTLPAGATTARYDGADRLQYSTDLSGTQTHTTYDAAGRVFQRIVDPTGLNLVTTTTYDAHSQLFETTDPAGIVTRTTYDPDGNVLRSIVDPHGLALTTTYAHDQDGNVLSVTSPAGETTQYFYDGLDRRTKTIVDPNGLDYVTTYAYDGDNHVVASTDANLNTTRFSYDDDGRLSWTVDGAGDVTHTLYDAKGNVTETIAYANTIDPASWDGTGVPPVVADPARDSHTLTVHDRNDRAIYVLANVGSDGQSYAVAQTHYDGNGNVLSRVTFATALKTTNPPTTVSGLDALVAQLSQPGHDESVRNLFDTSDNLTWSVDGLGHVQQFQYDASGRVIKRVVYAVPVANGADPRSVARSDDDRVTTISYDKAGRPVFTIDALGNVTRSVVDGDGDIVGTIAYAVPQPAPTATSDVPTADDLASVLNDGDLANRRTYAVFDAAGRETWSVDAAGDVVQRSYDVDGQVDAVTQYGKPITTVFSTPPSAADVSGALVAPEQHRTTLAVYDAAGRRVYTIDGGGYVTQTGYDGVGNATSTTVYANTVSGLAPGASLTDVQNALAAANGSNRTEYTHYDADGRVLQSIDALGGVEQEGYDGLGRRTSLSDSDKVTWRYDYDAAGKMTSEVAPSSDPSLASVTTLFGYDTFGNQTSRTEAAGTALARTTSYSYDALGRLLTTTLAPVGVYVPGADTINGAPDFVGPVLDPGRHDLFETLVSSNVYDTFGDLAATTSFSTGATDPAAAVTVHTYDKLGRATYDVDALGHVTRYGRNVFGDVTSVTRSGVGIAVSSFAPAALAGKVPFDSAQLQTLVDSLIPSSADPLDRTTRMTVDALGRTIEVKEPEAFVYDGDGGSHFGSATTQTTYDGYGEVVQSSVLVDGATNTWARTTNYYDGSGNQSATVDADGYATVRSFDALGNVTTQVEYAQATDSHTVDSFTQTRFSPQDRKVVNVYDDAERLKSTTQSGVAYSTGIDGSTVVGDLTTHYTYDAVGNQTSVTDALGQTTYNYYDGNGKLIAQVSPARTSVVDGQAYAYYPLTTFTRDVFGRVVVQTVSGVGAANPTVGGYSVATATVRDDSGGPAPDRVTYLSYDSRDNVTRIVDPGNETHEFSYDVAGRQVKSWAWASEVDGSRIDQYAETTYDAVGNVASQRTPRSLDDAESIIVTMKYDVFGELVRRDTAEAGNLATIGNMDAPDARHETFEYDEAGRLWRTNSNGGNVTITLYDQRGLQTAQLTSSGLGGATPQNRDMSEIYDAWQADQLGNSGIERTETRRDAMGHALQVTLPVRMDGTVLHSPVIHQQFDRWGNVVSQSDVRDAGWVTLFTYDVNNNITSESQPDIDGAQSAASPLTRFYYDALGRKVATRDADGNVNGQVWDSANNLVEEHHADGGVVQHAYDIFNEQVRLTTAMGGVTRYTYDAIGDNTGIGHVGVDVYTSTDGVHVGETANATIWTYSHYDALGRKIADVDGAGVTTNYVLDARGNVVSTITAVGTSEQRTATSAFNAEDLETVHVDASGNFTTWQYDGFGQLQSRTDIGGVTYHYGYDNARQLTQQTNGRGQNIVNTYDEAGQLVKIEDLGIHQTTAYTYNLLGEHVSESTVQNGQTYQLQDLGYDKLGRLEYVDDHVNSTTLTIDYDAVGNRAHEVVNYVPHGQTATTRQDLWFAYDEMNQQVMADGAYDANPKNTNNVTAQQGHILTYDKDGNRTSDTSYGREVVKSITEYYDGWGEDGAILTPTTSWVSQEGVNTHFYSYDKMDRLSGVSIAAWGDVQTGSHEEWVQFGPSSEDYGWEPVPDFTHEELAPDAAIRVDTRKYDADGREIQSGPVDLPTDYIQALVGNNYDLSGATATTSNYDVLGQIQHQNVVNLANSSLSSQTTFLSYDDAGNLLSYKTTQDGGEVDTTIQIEERDGYKEQWTKSVQWGHNGVSDELDDTYDVDGNLVDLNGVSNGEDRVFVNDFSGHVLTKTQDTTNVLHELVVTGKVMGTYGYGMGTKADGTQGFVAQANFDPEFTAVTNSYPNAATGQYPVQSGDSLESIALQAYGDSSLWYLIAEANDIQGDNDLRVGQMLNIPTKVNASHNNSNTYAPYDPSQIQGSSAPDLSLIHKKDKWAFLSKLIGLVVTVVVSWFLGPVAGAAIGNAAQQYSDAALNGNLNYGDLLRRGLLKAGLMLVDPTGMANLYWDWKHRSDPPGFTGRNKYDWKATATAVAVAYLTEGFGSGADSAAEGAAADAAQSGAENVAVNEAAQQTAGEVAASQVGQHVAQGVLQGLAADAVGQGVRMAFGEQRGFNWREFGASGVGGALQGGIGGYAGIAAGAVASYAISNKKWNTRDALLDVLGAVAQSAADSHYQQVHGVNPAGTLNLFLGSDQESSYPVADNHPDVAQGLATGTEPNISGTDFTKTDLYNAIVNSMVAQPDSGPSEPGLVRLASASQANDPTSSTRFDVDTEGPLASTGSDSRQPGVDQLVSVVNDGDRMPVQGFDPNLGVGTQVQSDFGLPWMTGEPGGDNLPGPTTDVLRTPSSIVIGPDDLQPAPSFVAETVDAATRLHPQVDSQVESQYGEPDPNDPYADRYDTNRNAVGDLSDGRKTPLPRSSASPSPSPSAPGADQAPGISVPPAPVPAPAPEPEPGPTPPAPGPSPLPGQSPWPWQMPSGPAPVPSGNWAGNPRGNGGSGGNSPAPAPSTIHVPKPYVPPSVGEPGYARPQPRSPQGGTTASQSAHKGQVSDQMIAAINRLNTLDHISRELSQQADEDAARQQSHLIKTGGAARGGLRGAGGSFEIVRNGNWDAALNIAADPYGILGELPDAIATYREWDQLRAKNEVDDLRQKLQKAGVKVGSGYAEAVFNDAFGNFHSVQDYAQTMKDLKDSYESFVRDKRLTATWGANYRDIRIGKSQYTVQQFEKVVLDKQQDAVNKAYHDGIEKISTGAIKVPEGKNQYARALGTFMDDQVRGVLRLFGKQEGIADTRFSPILAVNRGITSADVSGIGIPDNRIGFNLFADTTLQAKTGLTEQIMKWEALRPGSNYIMMRPIDLARGFEGPYVIFRNSIGKYQPGEPVMTEPAPESISVPTPKPKRGK